MECQGLAIIRDLSIYCLREAILLQRSMDMVIIWMHVCYQSAIRPRMLFAVVGEDIDPAL